MVNTGNFSDLGIAIMCQDRLSSSKISQVAYSPSYRWINPTYLTYNLGYDQLTNWDEPPSRVQQKIAGIWEGQKLLGLPFTLGDG